MISKKQIICHEYSFTKLYITNIILVRYYN